MFALVVFGGLVIANEIFVVSIIAPILFIAWFYSRVLKSQVVRVEFIDKAGTTWVYPALWSVKQNLITMMRSRKEKIKIKKKHNPRLVNFSAIRREYWFTVLEGSNETVAPAGSDPEKAESQISIAYEAIGVLQTYLDTLKGAAMQSLKAQLMPLMAGTGIGLALGIIAGKLLGI